MTCPVIESSHIIGKKWSIPIIEEIALDKFDGFNKFLNKSKNITPRILSKQLKELEKTGLIKKENYNHSNRNVTKYILTQKGLELHKLIIKLKKWNVKWEHVHESCTQTACTECPKYIS